MRKRGFEMVKGADPKKVTLPVRATKNSAGHDFFVSEDVDVPSIWKSVFKALKNKILRKSDIDNVDTEGIKATIVKTGVKSYMQDDEALFLSNRSSNFLERGLLLTNGVGVVDADYYGNPKNDGEIMFQFINFGWKVQKLKSGDKIGQGVFKKFLRADGDDVTKERTGGHGSTGARKGENE